MGPLASSSVIATPSFSNIFWKDKTGAKTPASHTVPAQEDTVLIKFELADIGRRDEIEYYLPSRKRMPELCLCIVEPFAGSWLSSP